jgi:phytoene dehydrogenase-like protein
MVSDFIIKKYHKKEFFLEKSIIIIGAGVAGLSAGCYARMNGFKTIIFEMNDRPGGQCISWRRKDFVFDPCIHWLLGTSQESSFYRIWEELGVIKDKKIIYFDEYCRLKTSDNREIVFYSNINKFMYHLKEIAPEDSNLIDEFTDAVRIFGELEFPVEKNIVELTKAFVKFVQCLKYFLKYKNISVQKFSNNFKNSFLKKFFYVPFDMPDFSLIAMMFTLAWFHKKKSGYPVGGSTGFINSLIKRYRDLGGDIVYNAKVERIRVVNDRVTGVKLEDGSKFLGDYVISACDGRNTIYKMLNGEFKNRKIDEYYSKLQLFPPILFISLGLNRDLKDTPHSILFELDTPLQIAGKDINYLFCRHTAYDPEAALYGKSVLSVFIETDYDYWKKLKADEENYKYEKQKIVTLVIDRLNKFYPGINNNIEIFDIATPVTFENRTGVWRGSYEGWLPTTKTIFMNMEKTLPGLENFYMIGQWTTPGGGIPMAAKSGRDVINSICQKEKQKFKTTTI